MISAFANIWRVPELRDRILFTLAMVIFVRLGVAVTLPGVDASVIDEWLAKQAESKDDAQTGAAAIGALLGIFSGGALQKCGIFALGIMPYISASIMMQLMTAVVPKMAKLAREDGGRQKINQYTRIVTIIISLVQGVLLVKSLENPSRIPYMSGIEEIGRPLVPEPGWIFMCTTVLTIVAATMLLMWIGDMITERGIGNGISLIISVNIISALPGALVGAWKGYVAGGTQSAAQPLILVGLLALFLLVIAAVISITQAQRRIAVQYAKRVVGRKQMTGQTQYLPLKVNYAGVMPIIFASAILTLPGVILGGVFADKAWASKVMEILTPVSPWYYLISAFMIFFFSYFWVATMFQPSEIAENLKRSGGYVPGVRPGKPTADFLDHTMTRLTFAGALFLTLVYIIPSILSLTMGLDPLVTSFFGGTSLLILVGVLLDVMRQTETHLLQRHYDGFLRKGKIKGRMDRRQGSGKTASSTAIVYLWAFAAALILIVIVAQLIRG